MKQALIYANLNISKYRGVLIDIFYAPAKV